MVHGPGPRDQLSDPIPYHGASFTPRPSHSFQAPELPPLFPKFPFHDAENDISDPLCNTRFLLIQETLG
jgi:hypothetical protein